MPKLNRPQGAFLQLKKKFRALVAGFGSGKTWAGCSGMMAHFIEHPRVNQGYFAPTFPHIRDIFYPTIEEVAHSFGFRVKINESNKEVHFYKGKWSYGTTICRSMSLPHTIVGFKIGNALIDELDVMAIDKARTAWRKVIARMRYNVDGLRNGVDVTTTPEGFKFTYEQFVEQVRTTPAVAEQYGIVHASTYDNAKNLPADYIPSLIASYPGNLITAYINGQFVNLTQGSVYPAYSRLSLTNLTYETIKPDEALHIGMDFNVGKMSAVVHVIREGKPLALDEFVDLLDTPAMIGAIKLKYPGRNISVYPDASGDNRKTQNASETDLALLQAAGYPTINNPANPAVRDRILCMNIAFMDGYKVNPDKCPRYAQGLEKQAYNDKGEPDKSSGFDHANDAGGYFITMRFPLVHNRLQRIILGGT